MLFHDSKNNIDLQQLKLHFALPNLYLKLHVFWAILPTYHGKLGHPRLQMRIDIEKNNFDIKISTGGLGKIIWYTFKWLSVR